jgi:hypothetical protein
MDMRKLAEGTPGVLWRAGWKKAYPRWWRFQNEKEASSFNRHVEVKTNYTGMNAVSSW